MRDDGLVPPMSPEDFAALAAIAGPLYQESTLIESYTSDNPVSGSMHKNSGSMDIRRSLEHAKQLAAQGFASRNPQPMYVPPAPPPFTPDILPPQPVVEDHKTEYQLELPFNKSEQSTTNDLLREISKKLSVIISLIETPEGEGIAPKSKRNVRKQNQIQ